MKYGGAQEANGNIVIYHIHITYIYIEWWNNGIIGIFNEPTILRDGRQRENLELNGSWNWQHHHYMRIFPASHVCLRTCTSGWWFGTFFIFPYIGNTNLNWLIFFRGVETTNQTLFGIAWKDFFAFCGDIIFTHCTRPMRCWNPANWTLVPRHSWKS